MCTRMGRLWGRSFLFFAMSFFATSTLQGAEKSDPAAKAALKIAEEQATEAVREALQREAYGLTEDREQLLSAASLAAPDNPAVRWQLGFVRSSTGEWIKAEERANKKKLALLKAYETRRAKAGDHAEGQLELADWCNQHGLRERERVHLLRVCELAPNHVAARQRLGFVRQGNDWVSRQDIAQQQQRAVAEKNALAYWTPRLEKLAAAIASSDAEKRQEAIAQLREIRDPAALPALRLVIGTRGEEAELLVVDIINTIIDPAATQALARHAAFSTSLKVRKVAVEQLKARPRAEFVPQIVSSMFTPVVSRLSELALPNGRIGYRQEFLREGAENHQLLVLDTQYKRIAAPNNNVADSVRRAVREGQRTSAALAQAAAAQNEFTAALNDRLAWVLNQATGANLPAVPDEWWAWWLSENEVYVASTKSVSTIQQSRTVLIVERDPLALPPEDRSTPARNRGGCECLAAGTPVWTDRGEVAIEKMLPGDLVLSCEVDTGELVYKPVLRTTVRPAEDLVKLRVGKETIETSGGHPFWVSGQGWLKSRNLQAGMVLHTLNGPVNVLEVGVSPAEPTYNLIVADFNTYFVGSQKILSHDNTILRPTNAIVPGLVVK
jgi:hypothetical protein